MEKLILYLTPTQMAAVRNIPLSEVFREIRQGVYEYQITDEGIKIPVTYCITTD